LLALLGLALLLGGMWAATSFGLASGDDDRPSATTARTTPTPTARRATRTRATTPRRKSRPTPKPVNILAVGAFDPFGDNSENDEDARLATDGDVATSWRTERYRSFYKEGVGLVVDAKRPALSRLVVVTDTPGYSAQIRTGTTPEGPFAAVTKSRSVGPRTTFLLRRSARYVVVWIVDIPDGDAASVNELKGLRLSAS
jgi:hypothetical protein